MIGRLFVALALVGLSTNGQYMPPPPPSPQQQQQPPPQQQQQQRQPPLWQQSQLPPSSSTPMPNSRQQPESSLIDETSRWSRCWPTNQTIYDFSVTELDNEFIGKQQNFRLATIKRDRCQLRMYKTNIMRPMCVKMESANRSKTFVSICELIFRFE